MPLYTIAAPAGSDNDNYDQSDLFNECIRLLVLTALADVPDIKKTALAIKYQEYMGVAIIGHLMNETVHDRAEAFLKLVKSLFAANSGLRWHIYQEVENFGKLSKIREQAREERLALESVLNQKVIDLKLLQE